MRCRLLITLALLLVLPIATRPLRARQNGIRFRDVAARASIGFTVDNNETPHKYQIEPMIAGVALFDYNNDGLLDIYFCNGAQIPQLEKTEEKYFNRLYRNQGGLRFEDVTDKAGVAGAGYSMGVAAADYNNDGWVDLYVTGVNRNVLYRNRGDGTFEDVTEKAGVTAELKDYGKAWSVGAGWFDYDNDGDLDLLVVNYCVWSSEKDPYCGARKPGYRTYCHPKHYGPLPNILYRNEGDGRFTDVSAESGIGEHLGKGMGVAFADFDGDGLLDAFICNDAHRNFLFRNDGDGRFEEVGLQAGVAYIDEGTVVSGMGADFQDYDGDGRPDIFMTALSNETFPLFRNLGNGMFRDERYPSGLGTQSLAWSGWSTGMVDFDNDGWLDLFVAGGHVQTNEELYSSRDSRQPNRLFRNRGDGSFEDISEQCGADFQQTGLHRGAAFGDLDNDGRVDAVVTRLNEKVEILHNVTASSGHWLILDLEGVGANRDGLGAVVKLTLESGQSLFRQATTTVGYASSSDKRIHFGVGKESKVRSLEITWPGGSSQIMNQVPTDRVLHIKQDAVHSHGGTGEWADFFSN
ncbi:CRTAC1 family protein [Acidobacteria bacterium AH-259-O06]|nr:CRTAC1 family protein [Acidobacteria bacterium AH-259-O06]